MGFIFGGGEKEDDSDDDQRIFRKSGPDADPVDGQEARVEAQEAKQRRGIDARARAMRRGKAGMSDLVTQQGRDNAMLGNQNMPTQSTLGPKRKI